MSNATHVKPWTCKNVSKSGIPCNYCANCVKNMTEHYKKLMGVDQIEKEIKETKKHIKECSKLAQKEKTKGLTESEEDRFLELYDSLYLSEDTSLATTYKKLGILDGKRISLIEMIKIAADHAVKKQQQTVRKRKNKSGSIENVKKPKYGNSEDKSDDECTF